MSSLSKTEQKSLYSIAQSCAFVHGEDYNYCPKTHNESLSFEPHDWVLKALEQAYLVGRNAGIEAKAEDFRKRLGL